MDFLKDIVLKPMPPERRQKYKPDTYTIRDGLQAAITGIERENRGRKKWKRGDRKRVESLRIRFLRFMYSRGMWGED